MTEKMIRDRLQQEEILKADEKEPRKDQDRQADLEMKERSMHTRQQSRN